MNNDMRDILSTLAAVWIAIILFITCPIWLLPFIVYSNIRDYKEAKELEKLLGEDD